MSLRTELEILGFDMMIIYGRRKELMSDVTMAEKEFGKTSPQANAARRVALQEMMKMPDELDAGRLEVPIVSKPFSPVLKR